MESPIPILLIDDSPEDAQLITDRLAADGLDATLERVETRPDFEAALQRGGFQLILSGYQLPALDGLTALALARKQHPDVPFILVSGTLGEELAVDSLKSGVSDCVLKQRLDRLAPVVRRALVETEERRKRRQAEAALRDSEAKHRLLFESSQDALMTLAPPSWQFTSANPATVTMFRAGDAATFLAASPWQWSPELQPDGRRSEEKASEMIATAMREGSHRFEWTYRRLDGEEFPATVLLSRLRLADQVLLQAAVRDSTERKRAEDELLRVHRALRTLSESNEAMARAATEPELLEEALRDSQNLYASLVEQLPQCVFRKDREGRFIFANRRFCELVGLSASQWLGQTDFDLFAREQAEQYRQDDLRIMASGEVWTGIERNRPLGAETDRFVEVVKWPLRATTGEVVGIQGIFWDVTAREQAAQQLRLLARAVEHSPVSIVITDRAGHIEFVNPKFTEVTGYSLAEVLGQNPRLLKSGETPAEAYRQLWETITAGREWRGEFHNRRKDGSLFWETASISPLRDAAGGITHFIGVKEDVTEKRLTEARFLRAQRLESVGTLASGIAHDLNNILAPILMAATLLRARAHSPENEKTLSMIEASAQRGADIVKQLVTFGRGIAGERVAVQLKHLIKDMVKIAQETFPRNLSVTSTTPANLRVLMGDATQLHQVLLNLCINARDAMPAGGALSVKAENTCLDESFANLHPEAKPGPYVRLEIADTGVGIPPENLERIFDPFFTTKAEGKGTGLGLSTVIGIVKSHGGFIQVHSRVGQGSTFEVFLPAVPQEPEVSAAPDSAPRPRGNGELILVVDDEPDIREATSEVLMAHGYRVLAAADGVEALGLFLQEREVIHVVLTDLMMPHMGGQALVEQLLALRPNTLVVVSSGLTSGLDEGKTAELRALGVKQFLRKPYALDELLTVLHDLLGST